MIDIASESFQQDPYPHYALLRQAGRAVFDRRQGAWLVGHYDDVRGVLLNSDLYSSRFTGIENKFHGADGRQHQKMRSAVSQTFRRKALSVHEPTIRAFAREALSPIVPQAECEFVADIAGYVPRRMLAAMLGAPTKYIGEFEIGRASCRERV